MIITYILSILFGWIAGSFLLVILSLLRCDISMCNSLIHSKLEDIDLLTFLRKKYYIFLFIDSSILLIISFLCYFFLKNAFTAYIITTLIMLLLGYPYSGKTRTNIIRFVNSLEANKDIFYKTTNN